MDRNNIIGFILMGILLFGYMYFGSQKQMKLQEQQKIEQAIQDSIAAVQLADSIANAPAPVANNTTSEADNPQNSSATPTSQEQETSANSAADVESSESTTAVPVAEEQLFYLEDDKLKLTLSSKGGRIVKAEIKDYVSYPDYINEQTNDVALYQDSTSQFEYIVQQGSQLFSTGDIIFDGKKENGAIEFTADIGGKPFKQSYALSDIPYVLKYNVNVDRTASDVKLNWKTKFKLIEKGLRSEREFTHFAYKTAEGDFKKFRAAKETADKTIEEPLDYIVHRQRFFNQTLFSQGNFSNTEMRSRFSNDDESYVKQLTTTAQFDRNGEEAVKMNIYIGPNDRALLKTLDKDLPNILPKGVFGLTKGLSWMYNNLRNALPWNAGLIILLMTFIIKLLLSPLTYRSYLSQAKMQVLKPELAELKEKFGKDQQKMSQEQMKLYSKAGVNPVGGCLPTLLQIPIFFSLYYFFRTSIFFRQKPFLWAEDLSTYDAIINLPAKIPLLGDHISLFAVLYGVALFLSMRFTQTMNGGAMAAGGNDMMKTQMKIMQIGMPIFLPVIFNSFPAALTFYYFVYNIINVIQTLVIKKFIINEDKIKKQIAANKKKVKKKSKFQQRLEEAMKAQQENQKRK